MMCCMFSGRDQTLRVEAYNRSRTPCRRTVEGPGPDGRTFHHWNLQGRAVQIVAGIEGFNQKHVSMTIDRSNQLHLVWDGTDNAHPNSLVKYSSLNPNLTAATWTNVYPRSQLNQSDPTLSTGERGMVFVAWQEWSGIDAASSNSAKSFIVQMSQDSTLTQLGTSFSANN